MTCSSNFQSAKQFRYFRYRRAARFFATFAATKGTRFHQVVGFEAIRQYPDVRAENDFLIACFSLRFITCMKVYEHIYIYLAIYDPAWHVPLFSVKWFKPQGIPCHGDSTSHKGNPSSSQGKWWTCYITSPWDPPLGIPDLRRVGQERSRRFFRRTTRGSSAPWRCDRWRSWWQPHVWKKGTISGDLHFRKRSFLWGAKEWSYILKLGEGFESYKDYSMLLGPGCISK